MTKVAPADSMATSVPLPMAMPSWARASAMGTGGVVIVGSRPAI